MEETSLIEFLKLEVRYMRELLFMVTQEEAAIKDRSADLAHYLSLSQLELLGLIKSMRPAKFKAFDPSDSIETTLLSSLKQQLELLVQKICDQMDRNKYIKSISPQIINHTEKKVKLMTETLEEEC